MPDRGPRDAHSKSTHVLLGGARPATLTGSPRPSDHSSRAGADVGKQFASLHTRVPFFLGSPCCWSPAASSGEHLGTRGLNCRCPHVRKQIDVETLGLHSAQHDGQKDATQRTADLRPVSAHPECLPQADRCLGQTHIHSLCVHLSVHLSLLL